MTKSYEYACVANCFPKKFVISLTFSKTTSDSNIFCNSSIFRLSLSIVAFPGIDISICLSSTSVMINSLPLIVLNLSSPISILPKKSVIAVLADISCSIDSFDFLESSKFFLALSTNFLNIPSCNSKPIEPSSFILGRSPSTKSE